MSNKYDDLDRSIDDLLADRRPKGLRAESPEELAVLKTAARFRAERGGAGTPAADFIARLKQRLAQEQRREKTQSPGRRRLLLGGLTGAAASLLAGIGLGRAFTPPEQPAASGQPAAPPASAASQPELVGDRGRWFAVAQMNQIEPGAMVRVRAGAVEGFITKHGDEVVALSAICTHMACILSWRRDENDLFCPCHGSSFETDGSVRTGRSLRPLPPLRVKVEGPMVYLWSVDDGSPSGAS